MFHIYDDAPAAGKKTPVRKAGTELPEGLARHGLPPVRPVDMYLVLVVLCIKDFPEAQPDGAAHGVYLNIPVIGGEPLYDLVKQSCQVCLRAGLYQIVERPDAETVERVVGGGSGEYKQTVWVKAAQGLRRIYSILISHVNIKEHKVKPFFFCGGKKIRAGGILKGYAVKGKAGNLYIQLCVQAFPF